MNRSYGAGVVPITIPIRAAAMVEDLEIVSVVVPAREHLHG
jgi:hypothetical protein